MSSWRSNRETACYFTTRPPATNMIRHRPRHYLLQRLVRRPRHITGDTVDNSAVRCVWSVSHLSRAVTPGLELSGVGRVEPPLQTLIFEWKSALNFNPWAKFQKLRQLNPPPPVLLGQFQHWATRCLCQYSGHYGYRNRLPDLSRWYPATAIKYCTSLSSNLNTVFFCPVISRPSVLLLPLFSCPSFSVNPHPICMEWIN